MKHLKVFLSHDVDWPIQGASIDHIMQRKDRFSKEVLANLKTKNPYYNIPEYIEIERELGVKSTWFFRVQYPTGKVKDYRPIMKQLLDEGHEIGLHLEPEFISSPFPTRRSKHYLDTLIGRPVIGNRVHYAKHNDFLMSILKEIGFKYDSTVVYDKADITYQSMGILGSMPIWEIPITIVDAFLFSYFKMPEEQVVDFVLAIVEMARNYIRDGVITLVWHNCSLQMVGGRVYPKILEALLKQPNLEIKTGAEIVAEI